MNERNRLEFLENRVRRLEWLTRAQLLGICAAGGLVLFLGASGGEPVSDVVRARSLEVVNEEGKTRALVTASADGPRLELRDETGAPRIQMGHGPDGTALYIKDAEGTTRIGVAQFAHGGGGVALHGEDSQGAAVLYLKGGKGSLSFYGTDGTVIERLPEGP